MATKVHRVPSNGALGILSPAVEPDRQLSKAKVNNTANEATLMAYLCAKVSINFTAMALILPVHGIQPLLGQDCFLAPNATLTGDVRTGDQCSFWFNAVVRGDVHFIRLGHRVNVQDGAVLHCTYNRFPLVIGNDVSIGHQAMVHGCTLHNRVLVGMGAIVMDGAVVESNTIIAAGAVVLEGMRCEANSVYAGIPAKKVKELTPDLQQGQIERIAASYVRYASWYGPQKQQD
jgi:carbonic anhydrase/acetyltransferase-like protein (isoleucine patch superfamily)